MDENSMACLLGFKETRNCGFDCESVTRKICHVVLGCFLARKVHTRENWSGNPWGKMFLNCKMKEWLTLKSPWIARFKEFYFYFQNDLLIYSGWWHKRPPGLLKKRSFPLAQLFLYQDKMCSKIVIKNKFIDHFFFLYIRNAGDSELFL